MMKVFVEQPLASPGSAYNLIFYNNTLILTRGTATYAGLLLAPAEGRHRKTHFFCDF